MDKLSNVQKNASCCGGSPATYTIRENGDTWQESGELCTYVVSVCRGQEASQFYAHNDESQWEVSADVATNHVTYGHNDESQWEVSADVAANHVTANATVNITVSTDEPALQSLFYSFCRFFLKPFA